MTPAQAIQALADGVRDDLQPFVYRWRGKTYKACDLWAWARVEQAGLDTPAVDEAVNVTRPSS